MITMTNFAFLIIVLNSLPFLILGLSRVSFRKTNVMSETFDEPFLLNTTSRSPIDCLLTCLMDLECKKVLFCYEPSTDVNVCEHYRDGENCISREETIQNKNCQCYSKEIQVKDGTTYCPIGKYGNDCELTIRDCNEGKLNGLKGTMLSYIKPGSKTNEELCDFDNGYTTIQVRRQDAIEVDFNRTWDDYVNGFGLSHSEHWLGLQNIYDLTNGATTFKLQMVIKRNGFDECVFTYTNFRLVDTIFYYAQFSITSVVCKNGIYPLYTKNNKFSTDDNRNVKISNCHSPLTGGWWLYDTPEVTDCRGFNLNRLRSELAWNSVILQYVTLRLAP